jgi:hypothetical protein
VWVRLGRADRSAARVVDGRCTAVSGRPLSERQQVPPLVGVGQPIEDRPLGSSSQLLDHGGYRYNPRCRASRLSWASAAAFHGRRPTRPPIVA